MTKAEAAITDEADGLRRRVDLLAESGARTLGPAEARWFAKRGRFLRVRAERGDAESLKLFESEQLEHRVMDAQAHGSENNAGGRAGAPERATLFHRA